MRMHPHFRNSRILRLVMLSCTRGSSLRLEVRPGGQIGANLNVRSFIIWRTSQDGVWYDTCMHHGACMEQQLIDSIRVIILTPNPLCLTPHALNPPIQLH